MKVGDYVRINENVRKICIGIGKITNIVQSTIYVDMNNNLPISFERSEINKSSPKPIGLIKVGDYVNGIYIDTIEKEQKRVWHTSCYGDDDIVFYNNDIKSIVTKEQFESMEYKVGE